MSEILDDFIKVLRNDLNRYKEKNNIGMSSNNNSLYKFPNHNDEKLQNINMAVFSYYLEYNKEYTSDPIVTENIINILFWDKNKEQALLNLNNYVKEKLPYRSEYGDKVKMFDTGK